MLKDNQDLLKLPHHELNKFPDNLKDKLNKLSNKYFNILHNLGLKLFNSVNKKINKNIEDLNRPKCMSTLRFNYYPGNIEPVE